MTQSCHNFEFMCLQWASFKPRIIGVLLLNRYDNSLRLKFTEDWSGFDDSDHEFLVHFAADLSTKAVELGPETLIEYLQSTLSNTLRITDAHTLTTTNPDRELERLAKRFITRHSPPLVSTRKLCVLMSLLSRACRRIGNSVRVLAVMFPPIMTTELRHGVVVAACVSIFISASTNLLRHEISSLPVIKRQQPTESAVWTSRHEVVAPPLTDVIKPPADTRRRRTTRKSKPESPSISRKAYIPPRKHRAHPQLNVILATEIAHLQISNRPAIQSTPSPLTTTVTSPTRPKRVGGVRRFLQRVGYPFRKYGESWK
jgi:hypothetical protein